MLFPVSTIPMRRQGTPDPVCHTSVTLKQISRFREAVYKYPCLAVVECEPRAGGSFDTQMEQHRLREKQRRDEERRLFGELSKYYWLEGNDDVSDRGVYKKVWRVPALLKEGKPMAERSLCQKRTAHLHCPQCLRT